MNQAVLEKWGGNEEIRKLKRDSASQRPAESQAEMETDDAAGADAWEDGDA